MTLGRMMILFIAAFLPSLAAGEILSRFGRNRNLFSDPVQVRFYTKRRPVLGHVALFAAFFLPFAAAFITSVFSDEFFYSLAGMKHIATGLFFSTLFLVISAAISDLRNDPGDYEWLYIIASALMLYFFGIRFTVVYIPGMGEVTSGLWGLPLLVMWVLLIVSIVELLDFFSGAAGGAIAILSLIYAFLHFFSGRGEVFVPAFFIILAGAAAGLLPLQAAGRIIFGKSGNKIPGFLFAAGTVVAYRKVTTGQIFIFPIAIFLFVIVVGNYLFLDSQLRPTIGPASRGNKTIS